MRRGWLKIPTLTWDDEQGGGGGEVVDSALDIREPPLHRAYSAGRPIIAPSNRISRRPGSCSQFTHRGVVCRLCSSDLAEAVRVSVRFCS